MSFNEIDDIIDSILDKFNFYIEEQKIYQQILKEANFVRYQSKILEFIEEFLKKNKINLSDNLKNNKSLIEDYVKLIIYYYFFIGLTYFYKNGRDSFITNMIEISKNQSKSKIKIPGFFNSNSNGLVIKSYDIVKNSIELANQKTIDRIKTTMTNAPIKFETTKNFINNIGLDFFQKYIVDNQDNFNILIKTIVIKDIYQKFERENLISIISQEKESKGEFKYITIVTAKVGKMVDYNVIEKLLTPQQIREGLATDIYNYILDYKEKNTIYLKNRENIVDYLFSEKILVPITEEFLRYHKKTENYQATKSNKDDTKAKYIISKLKKIKDYYSKIVQNDPKKKVDVKKLFYNQLIDRFATLVNQTEDAKIISKLQQSLDNKDIVDIYNDMENLTKYSYLNFNDFSKDGFKIRPSKEVEGVRYSNITANNKPTNLETRMGNDIIDLNVVGVMFIPEKDLPNLLKNKNLVQVDNKSPYQDFVKQVEKEFIGNKSEKVYFWLFDTKKDELKTEMYNDVSGGDVDKTIQVFLNDFYDKYYQMVLNKTQNLIKNNKINSFQQFYHLIDVISKKYADIHREPEIYNNLIKYFRENVIKDIPITSDEIDNMIPNKNKNLIKLPIVKSKEKEDKVILVEEKDEIKDEDIISVKSICVHHLVWKNISAMRKSDIDEFNQKIFDFVKKFVKTNDIGEYICKSCDELIPIQKYVYSGTYVEELDTFLTTSIAVNQNLESIPKYRKYNRNIKNLDRLVERIGLLGNFNIFLGNNPVIKLRRRIIVKDTLDLVLTHTDTLSQIMKTRALVEKRGSLAKQRYNIDPSYSKLFFFQLKDDIFLTSSEDTDKYKIVKYNNLITYLILMILLEINSGQILGIKETKFYNFYFYEKFLPIFSKLKLRINEKEVITFDKIPLLAYTIYIISGMITKDGIWFGTESKKSVNVEAQKEIIHSVIDLINSVIEESFKKEKNFIYDIFASKINNQIKGTFQDIRVFNMIKSEKKGKMMVNSETKKLQFMEKKHKGIIIRENITNDTDLLDIKLSEADFNRCYTDHTILETNKPEDLNKYITDEIYQDKLDKQMRLFLQKICARDKLENWEKKLCDKYGPNFDKKLEKTDLELFLNNIKNSQKQKYIKIKLQEDKIIQDNKKKQERTEKILNNWESLYKKENGFPNYLNKFINNLKRIVGMKIQTKNLSINLDDDVYIIDHDYLGNNRKDVLKINDSEGLFKIEENNSFFKHPVRYFYDKQSRSYLYYHLISHQYLGYSIDKKRYQKLTPNNYLKINFSVKSMIELLGMTNRYERILDYFNTEPENTKTIVEKVLLNRISRLNNLVFKANSIVYQIKYRKLDDGINTKEKNLVEEFTNRISNFNVKNFQGKESVFKNVYHIIDLKLKNLNDNYIIKYPGYVNSDIFNKIDNIDNNLLFYLLTQFNKLLDYNQNRKNQTEIGYMIISIIKYLFESYYSLIYSVEVQKFYYLAKLIDNEQMVDERVTFVGMYSELLRQEDMENEELLEKEYDAEQEMNALDIDDYEDGDENEAFDNELDREIPEGIYY